MNLGQCLRMKLQMWFCILNRLALCERQEKTALLMAHPYYVQLTQPESLSFQPCICMLWLSVTRPRYQLYGIYSVKHMSIF